MSIIDFSAQFADASRRRPERLQVECRHIEVQIR